MFVRELTLQHRTVDRVVGVFDTVGSLGLPAEFTMSPKIRTLFDFPDKILPEHIERAYHAMALDEKRADFVRPPSLSMTFAEC